MLFRSCVFSSLNVTISEIQFSYDDKDKCVCALVCGFYWRQPGSYQITDEAGEAGKRERQCLPDQILQEAHQQQKQASRHQGSHGNSTQMTSSQSIPGLKPNQALSFSIELSHEPWLSELDL